MAPAAKVAQQAKKKKEASVVNQQAKAAFLAKMAWHRPAPPDGETQDNKMEEDSSQNEPQIQYDEINMNDSNGTADLGRIAAVLDDEYESESNDAQPGVMKDYMKAIMK